jgi:hypothetical protein
MPCSVFFFSVIGCTTPDSSCCKTPDSSWWTYTTENKILDPEMLQAVDPISNERLFGKTKKWEKIFRGASKCQAAYEHELRELQHVRSVTKEELLSDWQLQEQEHRLNTLTECQPVSNTITLEALREIDES